MTLRARRVLQLVAGIVIAAVLLYLSFAKLSLDVVMKELASARLELLGLAMLVRLAALSLASLRSRIFLAPIRRFSIYRLFKSLVLGFMITNLVPLRAGELARVGYLARYGNVAASSCLAAVAAERLLDLSVLLGLFVVILPGLAVDLPIGATLYVGCGLCAIAISVAALLGRHPQRLVALSRAFGHLLGRKLGGFLEAKSALFAHGLSALGSMKALLAVIFLSALFWLCSVASIHLWLLALGLDLPWGAPVVVLAFLSLGLAVPTTPGNIGTYHFLAFAALTTLGVSDNKAGSFALLGHAMSIVPTTLIGVVLLLGDVYYSKRTASAS